jgi:hypothetical protein
LEVANKQEGGDGGEYLIVSNSGTHDSLESDHPRAAENGEILSMNKDPISSLFVK